MGLPLHDWDRSVAFGDDGVRLAFDLLHSIGHTNADFKTVDVRELAADDLLQGQGVDLFWIVKAATGICVMTAEVKADSKHDTGNFFFETISDVSRDTPGTFLNSQADWLIYTFPRVERVFLLPFHDTREWFNADPGRFPQRSVQTERGKRRWTTVGRLVPIADVLKCVPGVLCFERTGGKWEQIER